VYLHIDYFLQIEIYEVCSLILYIMPLLILRHLSRVTGWQNLSYYDKVLYK